MAIAQFKAAGVASPGLDANVLLGAAAGLDPSVIPIRLDALIDPAAADRFARMVGRRTRREPVAYITGRRAFLDFELHVAPGVLIPRPESEDVVAAALAAIGRLQPRRAIDVGTGSGAIAIALARATPSLAVIATDISAAALAVARANARALGVGPRVHFVRTALVAAVRTADAVVVANLPYIPAGAFDGLAPEVSVWEPRIALDGGVDGLSVIRALLGGLRAARPAACVLEIGADQAHAVDDAARNAGFRTRQVLPDGAGLPRVAVLLP